MKLASKIGCKEILYLSFLAVLFFLNACETNVIDDDTAIIDSPDCNPEISFQESIQPIITNSCIKCHNGTVHPLNFENLTVLQNNAGTIKAVTQNRTMPLNGRLTDEQIKTIACWVDNGAKIN
ncbi:hypothetical protein [Zunongwangia sp.]|uniref:hypothetical protein n=1 Tax=Zunongwangia sp. TaxID=1965325 RepID=UPI003AA96192